MLRVLGKKILVSPIGLGPKSGIVMPDTSPVCEGNVILTNEESETLKDKIVIFMRNSGQRFSYENKSYIILSIDDILLVKENQNG